MNWMTLFQTVIRQPVNPAFVGSAALLVAALVVGGTLPTHADDGRVRVNGAGGQVGLSVEGDPDDEWRFESTQDFVTWSGADGLGAVYAGRDGTGRTVSVGATEPGRFYRAVQTSGLYDNHLLRTISLTFTQANWATLLANGRNTGSNTVGNLSMDNGDVVFGVGARYKGNTSYSMGGTKKSVNIELNHTNESARLMGFRTINLNNAAGDETILREPIYFSVMAEYAPSPKGSVARLMINNEYWGVYSLAEQENTDLVDAWFPSNNGDRWRAPNTGGGAGGGGPGGGGFPGGGGGGGFASAASALSWLGTNVASYRNNYELKTDNSTNAWERLLHAIDVLNNTPLAQLRREVENVLAVDSWLWFLAVENIFADDDSYWNKGADYGFYYEVESGRIFPVEHDGNEAFTAGDVQLSPVQGSTGTNRPVISKFLAVPELRQRYLAHMRTVLARSFHPDVMLPLVDRLHRMSVAAIIADPKKNYTMTTYTNDLNALKTFVRNRYAYLTNHAELRPLQPVIESVLAPAGAPDAADVPVITARVSGAAGEAVDSVWLYYRPKSYGVYTQVQMFDDGAHGDGAAGDGLFGASTTAYPAGARVRYYVEARSANTAKAARFSPETAEVNPYSYRVTTTESSGSAVVINELMSANTRTLADPQGQYDDWIELRNTSATEVDLSGRFLSDDPQNPRKWEFPAGTKIAPNGYLLVWADEDGAAVGGLHANFKLSASGEQILFVDTDARQNALLDLVIFGALSSDRAYGRTLADPARFDGMTPTPGAPNR